MPEKVSGTDDKGLSSDAADSRDTNAAAPSSDSSTKELQERLEKLIVEMEEMQKQIEHYKKRAEQAEEEKLEARKSLAEMIEKLRRERAEADQTAAEDKPKDGELPSGQTRKPSTSGKENTKPSEMLDSIIQSRHPVTPPRVKELETAATAFATQQRRHNLLEQSTPYASMLGVVLLGVGIMAYLNGWQKVDK